MFEWSHIGQWLCSNIDGHINFIDEMNGEKILAQNENLFNNVLAEI